MESTWYLFPGQTLETTKIKDRGKALVCAPEGWKKLTRHLDRVKIQQEQLDEEEARRQYLKNGSYDMTKNWDNSIEKVRQRRLEEIERKIQAREENLVQRFLQLRKEQEEERNHLVKEARKRLYMRQEKSRNLNSALILSEVLFERNLQLEFKGQEEEHERIEEAKYAQCVKYNAEQEKLENAEKREKRRGTNVKHSVELKAQIKQIEEEKQKAYEEKMKAEQIDNKRAQEEMESILQYEKQLDREKKADVKQEFIKFAKLQQEHREQMQKQEEAEDKIIKICARAKCRIDAMKVQRDKEVQAEKIKIRERIAEKVMARAANMQEEENQRLANAQKEYEERARRRLEKDKAYQNRLRQEREDYRQQCIKRNKELKAERDELKKWDFLNRLKTDEVIREYNQDKCQKEFDEKIEYRKELFKQVDDLDRVVQYEKECKEKEFLADKKKLADDDKAFFNYAEEVLDLAKSRGRSLIPIQKIVEKYKIENELEPKKKNLSQLQSNVPINNKDK